jgi:all-trans-retinol 13,14-reductase
MMKREDSFDAIVIGSGIGGLGAAAILAKHNRKRVLVLEKHFQPGGLTHEFQRGRFSWDVGLHYVGEMDQGNLSRQVFDYVTEGVLRWQKMPYVFEKFIYPDLSLHVPSDPEDYQQKLAELFPKEYVAIRTYFRDIYRVAAWSGSQIVKKTLPPFIAAIIQFFERKRREIALLPLGVYLDKHFKSTRLKAVLASQWGDYGVPPREAAFAIHALIVHHYLHGGYFPEGGASSITKAIRPIIEREGGAILVGHSVHSIMVENGVAVGVRASYESGPDRKEVSFYAPIVISDIGAAETYENLLKEQTISAKVSNRLGTGGGLSAITVYLGLSDTPEKLGLHGENVWIYNSYDHDLMAGDSEAFLRGDPPYCYISFPSLKTPHPRSHTAEIIAFVNYDAFRQFKNRPWFNRDADYYDLKDKITEGLVNLADRRIPGFKDLVVYTELSTPLSVEKFTSRLRGLMYGVLATPQRYQLAQLEIPTPVKNCLLTGSDVGYLGIVGALMGGVATAAFLNGPLGFFRIIAAVKKHSRTAVAGIPGVALPRHRPMSNEISARLISRNEISRHFFEIIVEVPETVHYVPGQHCYLEVAPSEWRPYSIVSSRGNTLTFIIDSNPGGFGSRFAMTSALGTVFGLRLPTGTLRIHGHGQNNRVFVATGSGITPFISMLQSLSSAPANRNQATLLWGIRDVGDEFSSRYCGEAMTKMNLSIIPCISQPTAGQSFFHGTVTEKIRELQLDFKNTDFYLCGNPLMISEMHASLRRLDASSIYFEM